MVKTKTTQGTSNTTVTDNTTDENFETMADNELKNEEKKLRNEILESNSNVDSDKLDESIDR
jgi:hypothetical protein